MVKMISEQDPVTGKIIFKKTRAKAMHRKFWAGAFAKAVTITIIANYMLSEMGDDDMVENYKTAWGGGPFEDYDYWSRMNWAKVDITPIYKALGGETKERKYFSVPGHFMDLPNFILNPMKTSQHKGSVLYKLFFEAMSGQDWAGRRFTTFPEYLGLEDEELAGKTVTRTKGDKGPVWGMRLPSFMLHTFKGMQPVQVQNLLGWLAGEEEGFDAMGRALGLNTSSTYHLEDRKEKGLAGLRLKQPKIKREEIKREKIK
jgi:hypothetical protein